MKKYITNKKHKLACCFIGALLATNLSLAQDSGAVANSRPKVLIKTNAGAFTIELITERAPLTVANFLDNVESGFYTDTVIHRVVAGFVAQGGGYTKDFQLKKTTQKIPNESGNGLSNLRGTVAMARTSDPHSADSQFYINLADNNALDPRPTRWGYTVFGKVIAGMEVIDDIGYRATGKGPIPELARDVPAEPIIIESATLLAESTPTEATP